MINPGNEDYNLSDEIMERSGINFNACLHCTVQMAVRF